MGKTAIRFNKISKKFIVRHERQTLVEGVFKRKKQEDFWALKDIDFSVKVGESVGIIGPNGSGKTTLLELITGITYPTSGELKVRDRVVSIIGLEAGFHPDLTGEENIFINGLLSGMTKLEIESKKKKIIKFADIGGFIDSPLYTYSEGMKLRLGFSVAVHADPDILILDETLSMGDLDFRDKSFNKIMEFYKKNKTIIMVSHELEIIKVACERVILLKKGRVVEDGKTREVLKLVRKGY